MAELYPMSNEPKPIEFLKAASALLIVNGLLWWIIPALTFGNLHVDTLEAAYWTNDLAFGYFKHPPLLTWLISFLFRDPYQFFAFCY
jgi:hypothetical protein